MVSLSSGRSTKIMKNTLFISFICALLSVAHVAGAADAFTASDLARHLHISHWQSEVSLPPHSFSISLWAIRNGKIGETLLGGFSTQEGQKFIIMASDSSYGTALTIILGNATMSTPDSAKIPKISQSVQLGLPTSVKAGSYVLAGDFKERDGAIVATENAEDVISGLLLEITPNNVKQGAAANP